MDLSIYFRGVKFQSYDVKPERYEWDNEYEAFTTEEKEEVTSQLERVIATTQVPRHTEHKYVIVMLFNFKCRVKNEIILFRVAFAFDAKMKQHRNLLYE